nr:MAG TPA: hypothetical protein [Caudoviricetes sp.]
MDSIFESKNNLLNFIFSSFICLFSFRLREAGTSRRKLNTEHFVHIYYILK